MVSNVDANDPISLETRSGILALDDPLMAILGKKCVFLDIGANIGKICLSLAACGDAHGYAIEASAENFGVLTKSVCLNDFDIKCDNIGIWSKSGTIGFKANGPFGWVCMETDPAAIPIKVVSLDDYADSVLKDAKSIDFIKIDIEGSEVAALEGATNLLKRFAYPPIFLEANAWTLAVVNNHTIADLILVAESYGYGVYNWRDNIWLKYDRTYFFDNLCTNFMLLHPTRDNSMVGMTGGEYPRKTFDEMEDDVVKNLQAFLAIKEIDAFSYVKDDASLCQQPVKRRLMANNAFETGIATICNLRDYSSLCQRPQIAALLSRISVIREKIPLLGKVMSWYVDRAS